ncbi:MAG: alpha/beta hydrolase [Betaproteobacteria bacterium]|nr:alpha/beta hydrolase [Betaproteobacteria bacterium]
MFLKRPNKPTLHYRIDDHTDEWKNAPVMILQHGYGRSSRFWYAWVPYLTRHFRVVRPDLRGLGESPVDFDLETGLSIDAYIEDLLAIISEVSPDRPVHYCGESMGGILGMVLAATHSDRLRTLTMVSSPLTVSKQAQEMYSFGRASWQEALREMGSKGWAAAANVKTRFPPGTDQGLMDWYAAEMGKSNVDVLIALSKMVSRMDVSHYLERINTPTLGLYPSGGRRTGPAEEQIRRGIRGIRFVRMPTEYHAIQCLMPARCATELLHFAAQHDGIPAHE